MLQRTLKQRIRRLVGPSIQTVGYLSGIMKLTARLQSIKGAIILMYHSVADDSLAKWIDPANHVPADIFSQQMAYLASKRRVVALDELVADLKQGKTPPDGSIAITFDDGYLDNLTVAAPILDSYDLPATLFLPTGYIDRGESQWVDQAYGAFKFRSKSALYWGTEPATMFNLDSPPQYKAGYRIVCNELLKADSVERRALLNKLYEQLQPFPIPPRLTMNWDNIRTLLKRHHCFQIGGHTLEHTDLSSVSKEQAQKELIFCAQRIEGELGVRPGHFSFCYSRTSESLCRLTAACGFESACGGDKFDPVIRAPVDLMWLPRVVGPASMRRFDILTSSANAGLWRRLGR